MDRSKRSLEYINFENFGYVIDTVPSDIIFKLKEVSKIAFNENETANHTLAGAIEKEFFLPQGIKILENYVYNLCDKYSQYTNNFFIDRVTNAFNFNAEKTFTYIIPEQSLWVNFQSKKEYNPQHKHSGLYSFVIWLQVPYTNEQEASFLKNEKGSSTVAGAFSFTHSQSLGGVKTHTIPVDNSYEGKIALFPSDTIHSVQPFYTSDKFRISVAGNVFLNV